MKTTSRYTTAGYIGGKPRDFGTCSSAGEARRVARTGRCVPASGGYGADGTLRRAVSRSAGALKTHGRRAGWEKETPDQASAQQH